MVKNPKVGVKYRYIYDRWFDKGELVWFEDESRLEQHHATNGRRHFYIDASMIESISPPFLFTEDS